VILTYGSGVPPCSVLDHVDVSYRGKTIVLTLWEGHDPNGGPYCSALGRLYTVAVKVRGGTDDWTLVDGAKH
jgi:hypothetical protein